MTVIQPLDHRHQTLDLGEEKKLGYLDTDRYERYHGMTCRDDLKDGEAVKLVQRPVKERADEES